MRAPRFMSTSRNPYISQNGPPRLQNSVVAFIDILGYADMVVGAATRSMSQALLRRLHDALRKARAYVDPQGLVENEKDSSALRAFTDNIVIGYPIHDDAESELGVAFSELSLFQMTMSLEGFFIRGGIAIGHLYMDDIAVYGNGLIEAYKAETTLARDPRIVLARSARKAVDKHIGYYGRTNHAPQNRELLKDSDGQYFLDYMGTLVGSEDVFFHELKLHKTRVEEKLTEHRSHPSIWSKYLWVANYHNYFCEHCPNVDDSGKVETKEFTVEPARIITRT